MRSSTIQMTVLSSPHLHFLFAAIFRKKNSFHFFPFLSYTLYVIVSPLFIDTFPQLFPQMGKSLCLYCTGPDSWVSGTLSATVHFLFCTCKCMGFFSIGIKSEDENLSKDQITESLQLPSHHKKGRKKKHEKTSAIENFTKLLWWW